MRIFITLVLFFLGFGSISSAFGQEIKEHIGSYYFLENKGQWPNGVLYCAELDQGKIWLEQGRIIYQLNDYSEAEEAHQHLHSHNHNDDHNEGDEIILKQELLLATFVNANNNVSTTHKYPTTYYNNYFLGNDKSHWATNVRGYNHVMYHDLYSKIDLLFFEKDNDLKYEYHIKPGGNPNEILIDYQGYNKIKINKEGHLMITTDLGEFKEEKPYAYQIKNGKIVEIECSFELDDKNRLSYALGTYDNSLELIIDPVLVFATYCGSITDNFGMTATYAYDGKGYSGGMFTEMRILHQHQHGTPQQTSPLSTLHRQLLQMYFFQSTLKTGPQCCGQILLEVEIIPKVQKRYIVLFAIWMTTYIYMGLPRVRISLLLMVFNPLMRAEVVLLLVRQEQISVRLELIFM